MRSASVRWLGPRGAPGALAAKRRFDPLRFSPRPKTQLLILQPTPFCNINCDYCYLPNRDSKARMALSTVRQAALRLRQDDLVGESLTVVWHAGEPLTMPVAFYEDAVAEIREVLGPTTMVSHSVQTNGTLIDEVWCEFIKRHGNIRIGISVDGPAALHDRHRRTRRGGGTHAAVVRGMKLLSTHGIPFHAIAVVTDASFAAADDFIDFFLEHGVEELGCNFDEAEGQHTVSTLSGHEDAHAAFLERLLERSIESGGRFRVRELANALRLVSHGQTTYRWDGQTLPANAQVMPFALISVAWNGDFCTFSPELLGQTSAEFGDFVLGNVTRNGYLDCTGTEQFQRLWAAILRGTQACQQSCAHFSYCGGGAPANKLYENGDFASAETLYCRTMHKRPLEALLTRFERQSENARQTPAPL